MWIKEKIYKLLDELAFLYLSFGLFSAKYLNSQNHSIISFFFFFYQLLPCSFLEFAWSDLFLFLRADNPRSAIMPWRDFPFSGVLPTASIVGKLTSAIVFIVDSRSFLKLSPPPGPQSG